MKKKSLSQQSLDKIPPLKLQLTSNRDLQKCTSSRLLTSNSDPFENMKFSEKNRPSLRPILNRHRKSPSIENIVRTYSLKNDQPNNKVNKNVFGSLISHRMQKDNFHMKVKLPHINKGLDLNWEQREISTPFFKESNKNERDLGENREMEEQGKRNSRSLFFDHLKVNKMPDLRFNAFANQSRRGVKNL